METGFAVTAAGGIELETGFGNQIVKLDEIRGKELETDVRQVNVHDTAGTHGHASKVLVAGQNGVIVHEVVLRQVAR